MNKNRKNIRDISFMSKKNGRVIMVHSVIAREVARLLENDDRVEHLIPLKYRKQWSRVAAKSSLKGQLRSMKP